MQSSAIPETGFGDPGCGREWQNLHCTPSDRISLYHERENLKSSNILILSPNGVLQIIFRIFFLNWVKKISGR